MGKFMFTAKTEMGVPPFHEILQPSLTSVLMGYNNRSSKHQVMGLYRR